MSRTTVRISDLVEMVNNRNKYSTCSPEERKAWNSLLVEVLVDCDCYDGFRYLTKQEVPANCEPGIIWHEDGSNEHPDESRVVFYYSFKRKVSNTKVEVA